MILRDCSPSFQDDSNNDADADSDGISVISEPDENHVQNPGSSRTAACKESLTPPSTPKQKSQLNKQDTKPETRTPKKNKIKFNKPLTPPNTPIECDPAIFEKTDKKQKKRSYIHNRNDKVSSFLNILVAGTIATAAGLALGHLMGSKSDCANLSSSMNNDLTYKQLQYENYKLKHELQDLKRESWHLNARTHNKHGQKTRRNSTQNEFHVKISDSLTNNYAAKKPFVMDSNNNFVEDNTLKNDVFYGPKTYAESISSNSQKLDSLNELTITEMDGPNLTEDAKITVEPETEIFVFPGISSEQLNASINVVKDIEINLNKEDSNIIQNNTDSGKQQTSKMNTNVTDSTKNKSAIKMNTFNKDEDRKYRKKNLKEQQSRSKKGRSVSSGKESGDYENSVLSLDDKKDEKFEQKDNLLSKHVEEEHFDNKNLPKNSKLNRKHKDKPQEKKEYNEYQKANRKNSKITKFSDDKLNQKTNDDMKSNNSYKVNYKKERRQSRIDIEDEDKSISQTEIKQSKMKKNSDKGNKSESKNDRRKSDFIKQVKKDKYEEWEMKNGYEYYLPSNNEQSNEQSDHEQNNEVKHFPSEKTISSADVPIFNKSNKSKKGHKKNNGQSKRERDSTNDSYAFESFYDNDCNNLDGTWFTDLAKHREEQRNKRKPNNWLFDRARSREAKRDQDGWCFDRTKNKQNHNKRQQKKSTNFKSKL